MGDGSLRLEARAKVWLEVSGEPVLGEGGYQLLRAVEETGSIMGACKRLNISYRKALNYVRKIEARLGRRVLITKRGGRGGGEAKLTEDGKTLLRAFELVKGAVREALERASVQLPALSS